MLYYTYTVLRHIINLKLYWPPTPEVVEVVEIVEVREDIYLSLRFSLC